MNHNNWYRPTETMRPHKRPSEERAENRPGSVLQRSDSPVCAETAAHCPPPGDTLLLWTKRLNRHKELQSLTWNLNRIEKVLGGSRDTCCPMCYLRLHAQLTPTDDRLCSSLFVLQKLDGTALNNITTWNLSNALVTHGSLREHQASVLKTAILLWYLETILVVQAKLNTR